MDTIFDVIAHNLAKFESKSDGVIAIYRIKCSDEMMNTMILTAESPFVDDDKWLIIPAMKSIYLSFREKHPGVITNRKNKEMEMEIVLNTRPTYISTNKVALIEVLKTQEDMVMVMNLLQKLNP